MRRLNNPTIIDFRTKPKLLIKDSNDPDICRLVNSHFIPNTCTMLYLVILHQQVLFTVNDSYTIPYYYANDLKEAHT